MGGAQAGDSATGGLLPLTLQNSYRARYRAMRPEWQSSGDQLEALVRSHLTPESRILDLGCGRGGVVELFWRDVRFAAGLDPDSPSLTQHRSPGMPVLRGVGERLPFAAGSFDLIVCQAAFKNFMHPASALDEMHRVLRSGGTAVIQDMSSDASHADIEDEVKKMELGWLGTFTTKATLEVLRRRAYSPARFERWAAESPFGTCDIQTEGMSLTVRFERVV